MRKKIVTMITALAVLCSTAVPSLRPEAAQPKAEGTTYYVSTLSGKDSNNGTSRQTPFYSLQKLNHLELKPGDKILLECGSVFKNGYLHLFGQSGSEDAPIVIDQYGEGADPVIDTNGQGIWFQNYGYRLDNTWHQYQGYVSSSILLYDSEYVEIQNLEIVNRGPKIENVYNAPDTMDRTGVAAVAQDKGVIDHIHLKNLKIHDVIGNVYNKHMNNGGIYFTVYMPHDAQTTDNADGTKDFASSQTGTPRFDDVLIDGCSVINTNRWGIAVGYTALWGKFTDMQIPDEDIAKYGSTNVVIQNNYVKDAGGDSITVMYCDKPLVQYNVSDGAARQMHSRDYAPQGETQRFAAGIWPWKCKDAVFQYNEAFDTKNVNNENGDGQAWDADWSDGTIYQYNYSHHNEGGCLMVCLNQAYRTTFRYNISQNDLRSVLDTFGNPKAHIYNNVFYVAENVPIYRDRSTGTAVLENNIFYYSGETAKTENWNVGNSKTYSNNLYYNYANTPEDPAGAAVAKDTPVFEDPGKAPASTAGKANSHETPDTASVFDGYRLCAESPAIGAGKSITDANGYAQSQTDFFGNTLADVKAFDIGAHQTAQRAEIKPPAKPSGLAAGETTQTTAKISWNAPDSNEEVIGYQIKHADKVLLDLTGQKLTEATKSGKITAELTGLKAGTSYTLSVIAYKKDGLESEASTVTFTTKAEPIVDPKPEKPAMPPAPSVSPEQNSAQISWTAADSNAGVTGYKIMQGTKTLLDLTGSKLEDATDKTTKKITITLSGLTAETEYRLELLAYNGSGDSDARSFTFTTKAEPIVDPKPEKPAMPSAPSVSPEQNSAQISWTAADSSAGVTGYKIMQGTKTLLDLTGAKLEDATDKNAKTITITLSGLTAETEYHLELLAYNESGDSDARSFTFTTKAEPIVDPKPEKPAMPSAPSVSPALTTARISWTAADSSADIMGYKIMQGTKTLLDLTGTKLADATDKTTKKITITLSGLKAGTKYSLSLLAYNGSGNSDARTFTFTTKKPGSIKLSKKSLVLYTKTATKATLKATKSNISGTVKWKSSKPSVASVTQKGVVTAKKAGTATITAYIGNTKAACTVKVKKPSLKVKKSSLTIKKGKKYSLKATTVPKTKISYQSSNPKIASVSQKGVIKGKKKGNCKITVKCNGLKKTVKVKVK